MKIQLNNNYHGTSVTLMARKTVNRHGKTAYKLSTAQVCKAQQALCGNCGCPCSIFGGDHYELKSGKLISLYFLTDGSAEIV